MWGKIFGSFAGFAMGGPIGALFGAAAGHAYDKIQDGPNGQLPPFGAQPSGFGGPYIADEASRQMAFSVAVVVLGAKIAKVDGPVNRKEINAFKEVFRVPAGELKKVGRLFDTSKQDAQGFEPYARQLGSLFRHEPGLLEDLLSSLFYIARSDGGIKPVELSFLRRTSELFGLHRNTFERVRGMFMHAEHADPYTVLELSHGASDDEVKRAYRRLIREHHPDVLSAKGAAKKFIETANQKMATINAAYDQISRERGMK
ncbi:MAG: TerB family tellurite resistance protein [Rhodospirillales bacterium]|nr:TerB family tellurite resistance protein [Rhodospirillales bacterium]